MKYAIASRSQWQGDRVADVPGAVIVSETRLVAAVEALTGRGYVLSYPSVRGRLRSDGRVFVAGSGRGGIVIERIES